MVLIYVFNIFLVEIFRLKKNNPYHRHSMFKHFGKLMIKKVAMNEKGYSMGPTRILTDLLGK
jgi:hypothetical protein